MSFDFYVRSRQDLVDAIETFGIIPYFATSVPGFSLEEHCSPSVLWSDDDNNTWEWKGPVIRQSHCAYGKFFEKKAAYVSSDWFLDLANYRRDGYDFDARYDDGLAKYSDKELFEMIDRKAPVLSKELRTDGGYAYSGRWQKVEGKKGFDTSLAEGVILLTPFNADSDNEATQSFVAKYKEQFGEIPNQFAADGYDCIYAIYQALTNASATPDMDAATLNDLLIKQFSSMTFDGLTGESMTWTDGAVSKDPKGMVIQDGAYVGMD